MSFLATIEIQGIDKQGIMHELTGLISNDLNVNMRAVSINSLDGVFNGTIDFYIHNVEDLEQMITDIKKIKGVSKVRRIENIESID
jgi:GTP pyrophosphokinase